LIKTTPVAITSGRGKMPLEVTPFFPRLTRYGAVASPTAKANAPPESSGESKSDGSQLRVDTSRN
jgi:hypothetical protein